MVKEKSPEGFRQQVADAKCWNSGRGACLC
jgi:hypothetical protein